MNHCFRHPLLVLVVSSIILLVLTTIEDCTHYSSSTSSTFFVLANSTNETNTTTETPTTTTNTSTTTSTTSSTTTSSTTTSSTTTTSTTSSTTTTTSTTTTEPTNSTTTTTTTTTIEPDTTAPPTPVPVTMLSEKWIDRAWYASGGASFFSAIGSMPSAPFGISRAMSLISLSHCSLDTEELLFPQTLGSFLKVGVKKGEYLRGAMAGNTFLLVFTFCVLYLIGVCRRDPSDNTAEDPIKFQLMNGARLPSYIAIIYALFLDGTVSSSFKLVKITDEEQRGQDIVGFLFTIGFQIFFGIFLFYQLRHVRDKLKPMAYLDSEIRSKTMDKSLKEKLNSDLFRALIIGREAWVPYDEDLEDYIPAEAKRVYHLMFHYRDIATAESVIGRMMPNFFFVDAVLTFMTSAMRGTTVPCVRMLWGVCVMSALAALFIGIYKPYQVPIINVIGCLQNIGICIGGLMIQSGVQQDDFGRTIGELIALGSAALGFVPTLIVGTRTFLLWRGKGYYARVSRSEEDLMREEHMRERLGIKDIEAEAADKKVHIGGLKAKSLKEKEREMTSKASPSPTGSPVSRSLNVNDDNDQQQQQQPVDADGQPIRMTSNGLVIPPPPKISPALLQLQSAGAKASTLSKVAGAFNWALNNKQNVNNLEKDSLLEGDSDDDDQSQQYHKDGRRKSNIASTVETDSRNEQDLIDDPNLSTENKLDFLLDKARARGDDDVQEKTQPSPFGMTNPKNAGVGNALSKFKMAATLGRNNNNINQQPAEDDDDEVVSVDSCVGVLTRKASSRLNASMSGLGNTNSSLLRTSSSIAPPPSIVNPKKIKQPLQPLSSATKSSPNNNNKSSSSHHHYSPPTSPAGGNEEDDFL